MIAQTSELPAEPIHTVKTIDACRPGMHSKAPVVVVSFAVATVATDEDDAVELVRPPAMVQGVLDHLDEPISG